MTLPAPPELLVALDLAPVLIRAMGGCILHWSAGIAPIYGYEAPEAVGRISHELLRTEFPEPLERIEHRLAKDGCWTGELQHRRKDGAEIIVASRWTFHEGWKHSRTATVIEANNDVTEIRRAELDRLRLAAIVESSDDAIIAKSLDGTIVSWNPAAERMLGYSAAEMLGRNISVLAPPGEEDDMRRILERLRRGEQVDHYETRRRRKDGTIIDVSLTVSPIRDARGTIIGASKIARDITERNRSAAALAQSERHYRAAFEQAAVGMAEVALDGRWLRVNNRLCEILGYSRDELLARMFQDITHPDDLHTDVDLLRRLLAGEMPTYTLEKRYLRKTGGEAIWVELTVGLVRNEDGTPAYAIAVIQNITARKAAEAALAESEARYRALFETVPLSVIVIDLETLAFVAYNPQAYEGLGYTHEEFARLTVRDIEPTMQLADIAATAPTRLGQRLRFETRHRTRTGELRDVLVAAQFVEIGGRRLAYTATADISDLKQAQAELRKLNAELEARVVERTRQVEDANRQLEAFAYSIAHDLRAPLRTMSGFTNALIEDYGAELDPTARDYAARVRDGARRLDALIDDLLTYSRLGREEVRLGAVDLEMVVDDVLTQFASTIADCGATVSVVRPLPRVVAQQSLLTQAIANLIGNALKYARPGVAPTVLVRAETLYGGDDTAAPAERGRRRVRLWVEDRGIGVAPQHHARIFEVFQRLHSQTAYSGTGIGLAIVRRALERMGGSSGVESAPGEGSRFWIELEEAPPNA